jgi:predicted phage terminase large subunit-like protein
MSARPTEQEALNALLRTRLAAFIRKSFHTVDPGAEYSHNWHVDLIAEYLEACHRREIKRLIINVPPRYMKSIAVTVAWPAWLLGKNPSERIIAASYSHSLSLKHSTDCRLVLKSEWYRKAFPNVALTDDQDTKEKFVTTERGMRYATSVGGSVTGEGGNFLIFDDPHNPQQALSDVQRQHALTWFDQTFASRLNDKQNGVIVGVMQRLHANDLTGHLLEKGGWEHVSIPQVAEVRTIIDFGRVKKIREVGDILHESRENSEAIERLKRDIGSYAWAGQYQQRPAPAEGGMCKATWFKRYDRQQDVYEQIVQSWDTASKANELNDPSVCTTWGVRKDGYDLLQVMVRRLEFPQLKALVRSQAEAFSPDAILIEDKSSGQALLQDLKKETKLPVIAINPTADKITRFAAVTPMIEAGRIALPTHAAWLTDYEMEMYTFPNAPHDDQVDSTSQLLEWMRSRTVAAPRIRSL